MKLKSFNVAIYPSLRISKKAINISKKLKKKGGLFVLDGRNYFPHITLYMTEFPLKNVPKIRKLLREIAGKTKPFRLNSLKYQQSRDGYIEVAYRKSKPIREFQKKIIALLNPLREGLLLPKDKAQINKLSRIRQHNIKRYGYRSVGAEFPPHLTFTKLEKFNKSALTNIPKSIFSFKVDRIGLFY